MAETLKSHPKRLILGQTESIKGRKTRFELLLTNSSFEVLQIGDFRFEGIEQLKVWNVDKDRATCQLHHK